VKVLGLDPGSRACGFGLVETAGGRLKALEFGVWRLKASALSGRLSELLRLSEDSLRQMGPAAVAIETVFTGKNIASAVALAQARGVLLAAAARAGVPIYEYEPLTVKKTITSYGRAEKRQVRELVLSLLGTAGRRVPLDAADALAAAVCHCHHIDAAAFDPRLRPC
jgi:crossover junction endodeoxyribonuclease RuvC